MVYAATATNFLQLIGDGSSHTKWLLQRQLPYSLCLEEDVDLTGITALNYTLNASNPSQVTTLTYNGARVPNSTIYGGYIFSDGIGIASLEIDCFKEPLDTYWEDNGSPGDPEPTGDDKTGECIIIKHYYNVTKNYDSDGNFLTSTYTEVRNSPYKEEQTTNYINVMDESSVNGYELKHWATSNSDLAIDVPSPDTEGEIKFSNTSGCDIVSDKATPNYESTQTYIILILVNEETDQDEDDLDDYFEITESTLTKRVNFSQVTLKLKEATFEWTRNQFDSKAA
jgi:hypothetical protein